MSESLIKYAAQFGPLPFVVIVQLGLIYWLIRKILSILGDTKEALEHNTNAFKQLTVALDHRPCLHDDRVFDEIDRK